MLPPVLIVALPWWVVAAGVALWSLLGLWLVALCVLAARGDRIERRRRGGRLRFIGAERRRRPRR